MKCTLVNVSLQSASKETLPRNDLPLIVGLDLFLLGVNGFCSMLPTLCRLLPPPCSTIEADVKIYVCVCKGSPAWMDLTIGCEERGDFYGLAVRLPGNHRGFGLSPTLHLCLIHHVKY